MINEEVKNELKEKLLKEKEELKKTISSIAKKDDEIKSVENYDANFPEFGRESGKQESNVGEMEEYLTRSGEETALEKRLRDIDLALSKIEKGNYGECENCSKEISEARLKEVPEARICMDCNK